MSRWREALWGEIEKSRDLQIYGACLAAVHLVTLAFWSKHFEHLPLYYLLRQGLHEAPLCWPYFTACNRITFSYWALFAVDAIYMLLTLASIGLFAWGRRVKVAWWTLFVLCVLKYVMMSMDYRSQGNYHYMPMVLSAVYLFLPNKSQICRLFITLFYFAAGFLKVNSEWLTGAAMIRPPPVQGALLEWLCFYAVLLELVLVWGLWAPKIRDRWLTLFQLACFHLFSFFIVGYFYPVIMALLLVIFPLAWRRDGTDFPRLRPVHVAAIGLFMIAQLIPLVQKGDAALFSRGRLYSLNMFDARSICSPYMIMRYDKASYEVSYFHAEMGVRVHCDPVVYWNDARNLCKASQHEPGFKDIDIMLVARRTTDHDYTQIYAVRDFCSKKPPYNTLWPNAWMDL